MKGTINSLEQIKSKIDEEQDKGKTSSTTVEIGYRTQKNHKTSFGIFQNIWKPTDRPTNQPTNQHQHIYRSHAVT